MHTQHPRNIRRVKFHSEIAQLHSTRATVIPRVCNLAMSHILIFASHIWKWTIESSQRAHIFELLSLIIARNWNGSVLLVKKGTCRKREKKKIYINSPINSAETDMRVTYSSILLIWKHKKLLSTIHILPITYAI